MNRYALALARPDGTRWRTVHLWADSAADAIRRGTGWLRRERLADYTVADVWREDG